MIKPHVTLSGDGALNMEWIFEGRRAAIHIETNPKESSWNMITADNVEYGLLSDINIKSFVEFMQTNPHDEETI